MRLAPDEVDPTVNESGASVRIVRLSEPFISHETAFHGAARIAESTRVTLSAPAIALAAQEHSGTTNW
jgi:hypothetical protein